MYIMKSGIPIISLLMPLGGTNCKIRYARPLRGVSDSRPAPAACTPVPARCRKVARHLAPGAAKLRRSISRLISDGFGRNEFSAACDIELYPLIGSD